MPTALSVDWVGGEGKNGSKNPSPALLAATLQRCQLRKSDRARVAIQGGRPSCAPASTTPYRPAIQVLLIRSGGEVCFTFALNPGSSLICT